VVCEPFRKEFWASPKGLCNEGVCGGPERTRIDASTQVDSAADAALRRDWPRTSCVNVSPAGVPECYTICITMRFEWDSKKTRINQTKHNGLDFETAARVFDDPNVVLMHDRVIDGEHRWHAIGAVSAALPAGRAYIP
jgi:hypothetical protein